MNPSNKPLPRASAPSVGIDEPDAEHSVQMGLIRAVQEALASTDERSSELMAQLCDYTEMHFMSEQLLMRLSARPHYEAHIAEHERLLEDVWAVRDALESGEADRAREQLQAHERDILDHICSWDRSI